NTMAHAADFSATISWGDSQTSAGTIAANGSGGFNVSGSHTYAGPGTFTVSVSIHDVGGSSALAASTANVVDAFEPFVSALYQTVLNRGGGPSEVTAWVMFLHSGGTRARTAQLFWESGEHRGIQVDGLYQTYLGRAADSRGRASWVAAMVGGMTEFQVIRAFIASAEYQAVHPSNASYVDSLYNNILGRHEGLAEQAPWVQFLQSGGTR